MALAKKKKKKKKLQHTRQVYDMLAGIASHSD